MSHHPRFGNRFQGRPARRPSVVSTTSGIADSTISMGTMVTGESLRLSQFPQPPHYTPLSPVQSEMSSLASVGRRDEARSVNTASPASVALPRPLPDPHQSINERYRRNVDNSSNLSGGSRVPLRSDAASLAPSHTSRTLSPYDWHEGASSIDVDATDDRMLPTSFITQLLRENPGPPSARGQRMSTNSDGLSAFSELTYPPPPHRISVQFPRNTPPVRPAGGRPPPGRHVAGNTSDTETLINHGDDSHRPLVRTASVAQRMGLQGNIVGVASATIRSVGNSNVQADCSRSEPKVYDNGSTVEWESDSMYEKGYTDQKPDLTSHSPPTNNAPRAFHQPRGNRKSVSSRSIVSSLLSRAPSSSRSVRSLRRAMDWIRVKPLPPVPALPQNLAPKRLSPNRPIPQDVDEDVPLPELINRAGTLSNFLEKGYHPHQSMTSDMYSQLNSKSQPFASAFDDPTRENTVRNTRLGLSFLNTATPGPGDGQPAEYNSGSRSGCLPRNRLTRILFAAFLLLLVVIAVSVGVAVSRSMMHKQPNCPGNSTGSECNLDATCVCTLSSTCNPLAQNLATLRPVMNQLFGTNYSANSLATSIWLTQGDPTGNNCASQARLVDTGNVFTSSQSNRTQWAQSSLLWNLVQSQNLDSTEQMRKFILKAPWKDLGDGDGPVTSAPSSFTINSSGFSFNFAAQTVGFAANATFRKDGHPPDAQAGRVGGTAQAVLDRMYTRAIASSSQRSQTLEIYWRNGIQQNPNDLPVFQSYFMASPILLPFNAAASGSQSLASLMSNSSSASFPPPLACYPGLSDTQVRKINSLETNIFNLPAASPASQFSQACFADRPVYGVLDVLNLRLPFLDARSGLAKQAVRLKSQAASRVVVYNGEALGALPAGNGSDPSFDTYQYGVLTSETINHVIYQYLSSMPDVNIARALVQYVLSRSPLPPTNPALLSSLPSIQPLEVAVFGSIDVTDVDSVASSLVTPSGALFFGSDSARNMRNWAINNTKTSVVWTELATSAQVARDKPFTDADFTQTWEAAATNPSASVQQVVNALQTIGKLGP
ncbi:hypothetical protein HGRIS_007798 [Hohenbuehelia grisea]|uniref:Uncharacterized protein n=1 Tax=Hohenbuehelia grisea TaxID=104357 RepID=A0ABR3J5Z9_9AGAR